MRDKLLKKLAHLHVNHPWRMLALVIVLTLIFGALSEQLDVTMRWSDLLPSGDRRTIQFNKIIDEFVSATSIIVVVQGEKEEQMKKFADELYSHLLTVVDTSKNAENKQKIAKLNKKIEKLKTGENNEIKISQLTAEIKKLQARINKKLVRRVDYKMEVDFLKNHGLMLLKEDDLKNMKDIFTDPNLLGVLFNINNAMEKEYVGQEESISTREKEDQAVMFLDGIQNLVQLMQKHAQGEDVSPQQAQAGVDKLLLGEPYFLSYDEKALILNVIPNFTMFDLDLLVSGTEAIKVVVDEVSKQYPEIQAGLTGMMAVGRDEMVYSQQSLGKTSIIAIIAILALLIVSFRMWIAPLFAMFNLLIGILWAIGVAALVVGQLNIMTQMMAVILLGLGIDFSIHIISGFTEWRAAGDSIATSMEKTFLKSGKGILTGGLTTAFAFLTMIIASSRGMKEMGIVTGLGLLAILLTTFLFLPIMLVFRERFREISDMNIHVKILAILHIIFGILGIIISLALLIIISFFPEKIQTAWITYAASIYLIWSVFELIGGLGLKKHLSWARIIILIIGFVSLMVIPVGTIVGIYTLWALLKIKKPIARDISTSKKFIPGDLSTSKKFVQRDITFKSLGQTGEWLSKRYVFTILASIIITILLIWSALNITFDYNYMNIEPKGLESIALQDTVLEKFDMTLDYGMILTDNIDDSREMAEKYRDMGTVAMTEDISLYLPSLEQQEKRKPHIEQIYRAINSSLPRKAVRPNELTKISQEIERLEKNVMEMQDMAFLGGQDKVDNKCKKIVGDPENANSKNMIQNFLKLLNSNNPSIVASLSRFQQTFAPYFKESVIKMCSIEPILLEQLPASIMDRYSNEDKTQFLVTVFPAGNMWTDARFLYRFVDDLERVSNEVTGFPPVFRALVDIIGRDGRRASLLTLIIVFILLWLDFRSIRHALMAMIPLAVGLLWMIGLMHLTGQQLTVMNVMALPMILGIGIDDGVHIVHRWQHEGKGKILTVFASTGKAIMLTSLTTMLAFGSLVFSIYRGFGQLGAALFVGVAACFLTTVIILSGIIGMVERER